MVFFLILYVLKADPEISSNSNTHQVHQAPRFATIKRKQENMKKRKNEENETSHPQNREEHGTKVRPHGPRTCKQRTFKKVISEYSIFCQRFKIQIEDDMGNDPG
ncbi:hypothetical protein OCU04_003368 [Sclerotinia nivalis]|uniref:Uncharacterized protein n=1 Tax=Sclerotinia nivalis TaxID=352851 RepID=A0A9X0ARV4_9HELO|nr:hypothetical protein OCU04_003368 [Sclerotinia nivalis]